MLIILDRDGVVNHDSDQYIKSPNEWIAIEGSLEAIADLTSAGHLVVIATNQSGLARGYYTLEILEQIHEKLRAQLASKGGRIERIYYCPHHPNDNCACRKPKPGLLLQIKRDYPHLFADAIFVGDSVSDIQAAKQMGIQAVLVKTGKGEKTLQEASVEEIQVYSNLREFVSALLAS